LILEISLSTSILKCQLDATKGELLINDVAVVLRPKTFELLLLLASKPGHVFSKVEILATVWQNAVVEDQVIFQSINEIRKETGYADAIKTYPRRGYSWEILNTVIDSIGHVSSIDENSTSSKTLNHSKNHYLIAFLAVVLCSWLYIFISNNESIQKIALPDSTKTHFAESNTHKGLLVLPFNVDLLDGSQKWLKFGAMEGLIKKISPNNNVTVFHLEDVIEILNRLPVNERSDVNKIFDKSGASYILATSLSGVPGEFNIIYTLYSRYSRISKTMNAMDLNSAFSQLVDVFEDTLDEKFTLQKGDFNKQLQNDLIAKAIQFLASNDNESALSFIESAVINDADNIMALYYLSKIAMNLNNIDKSLAAANKALTLHDSPDIKEYQHRLLYLQGTAFISLGKLEQAKIHLLKAELQAKAQKDWLYYAYSQSMLGKVNQYQGQYKLANQRFTSALEYQELLHCPMGVTQGYVDIAELYLVQGEFQKAQTNLNVAENLVHEKNLKEAIPLLQEIKQSMIKQLLNK
jgi:DNA-binding winged helix-turn-helix (wHTH) protein/tetratricopeptide (TPR) repeat protein